MNNTTYRDEIASTSVYDLRASVPARNSGIGNIPSFSTLPGNAPLFLGDTSKNPGAACVDVIGTCSNCSECFGSGRGFVPCYAAGNVRQYRETAKAYARNTRLLREAPEFLLLVVCAAIQYHGRELFRFNVSGDVENVEQLKNFYFPICDAFPGVKFAIYTKRPDLFQQAADEGAPIPDNLAVNWSLWNRRPTTEEQATARAYGMQFAIYDDGTADELAELSHCLKNNKHGRKTGMTCDRCKICYNKRPCGQLAIYAH